jgi:hypothetical protein
MRDLTGTYRARGENSYTGEGVVGELTLTQVGRMLVGAYHFWEEGCTGGVSFQLPWCDGEVVGEVLRDDLVPRDKAPNYGDEVAGGWDLTLRIGEQNLFGVLIKNEDRAIAMSKNGEHWDYCEVFYRHPTKVEICSPFENLMYQLRELGSSLDARDHGCDDAADRMEGEALAQIKELLDIHPEVSDVLPDLAAQTESGSIAYSGWYIQLDRAQAYVDGVKTDRSSDSDDELSEPFTRLIEQLRKLGSANDAEDHGYDKDANDLRDEAFTSIRELMDRYPRIGEVLGDLARQVTDRTLADCSWSIQRDRAQAYLDGLKAGA